MNPMALYLVFRRGNYRMSRRNAVRTVFDLWRLDREKSA